MILALNGLIAYIIIMKLGELFYCYSDNLKVCLWLYNLNNVSCFTDLFLTITANCNLFVYIFCPAVRNETGQGASHS